MWLEFTIGNEHYTDICIVLLLVSRFKSWPKSGSGWAPPETGIDSICDHLWIVITYFCSCRTVEIVAQIGGPLVHLAADNTFLEPHHRVLTLAQLPRVGPRAKQVGMFPLSQSFPFYLSSEEERGLRVAARPTRVIRH